MRLFTDEQEKEICRIYFSEKLSIQEVAKRFNCSCQVIRNAISRSGLKPRTLSEAKSKGRGELSPAWKGGRIRAPDGYIYIHTPKHPNCNSLGYVYEHRLIMEKHLGRYLVPEEAVHHINGDPGDNRIENLMLFVKNKDHMGWHKLQRKETKLLKANFLVSEP